MYSRCDNESLSRFPFTVVAGTCSCRFRTTAWGHREEAVWWSAAFASLPASRQRSALLPIALSPARECIQLQKLPSFFHNAPIENKNIKRTLIYTKAIGFVMQTKSLSIASRKVGKNCDLRFVQWERLTQGQSVYIQWVTVAEYWHAVEQGEGFAMRSL